MTSPYEQRFQRDAAADPKSFNQGVKAKFGHDARGVNALLQISAKLATATQGLSRADIATLQKLHPQADPDFISGMAAHINRSAPHERQELFSAALAGDRAALRGDFANAGEAYREIQRTARDYLTESYAQELNARRGGVEDASPAWRSEPGSVRDIIERQVTPKPAREFAQAYQDGDPQAQQGAKNMLADALDDAAARLVDEDASRHDAVRAAFDLHQGEQLAAGEFGITNPEA